MKLLATASILALLSAPAFADMSGNVNGHFSGTTQSTSITGGATFGNGSTLQEAAHFAGARSELSGGIADVTPQGASINGMITSETFSEGRTRSITRGSSLGGALEGGFGHASGSYWGEGFGDW